MRKALIMDESIFKMAIAAVSSGDYCESDIKIIKNELDSLNRRELALKRQIEKSKNDFVKNKNKSNSELKILRTNIKLIKNILKST